VNKTEVIEKCNESWIMTTSAY